MPTLPLYDPTAHPDGWHDVRAPGGYEWWYFDAEDEASDTQVVAILMQGFIFHPGYLRAVDRYQRRPTRHTPPTAGDYPCAYACVYRQGRIWRQFFTQYRPADFVASRERVDVRVGPNRLWMDEEGAYQLDLVGAPWRLTARGPITEVGQEMRVRLGVAPTRWHAPVERIFLSREMTGAEHHWTIAAPRCRTSGSIRIGPSGGAPDATVTDRIDFSGHGYHDHNYGTAPIRRGLYRWIWGRAMFGDRVMTFHHAEPRNGSMSAETHLVEASDAGARDIAVSRVDADWSPACTPAMMLRYPRFLRLGEELHLSNPRVIDPSPFYLRLVFDAVSRGESSRAFCEVAYPHRLAWPILGRMIEMSFDKRPMRR
jgi:carotenoid 1,2-hydratase